MNQKSVYLMINKYHFLFFCILVIVFLHFSFSALACRPNMNSINRPIALKLSSDNFFIGTVKEVSQNHVTFKVNSPGGPAIHKEIGDEIVFDLHDYGTCGNLIFTVGDVWLYNGESISFSDSQRLTSLDLRDGFNIDDVKKNIVERLDPGYKQPLLPTKTDRFIPGVYSHKEKCPSSHNNLKEEIYTLFVEDPDKNSTNYKIRIENILCNFDTVCSFSGEAPAYGYGEIVIPIPLSEKKSSDCRVIIQQKSRAEEWPRLEENQARVVLSDYSCMSFIKTCPSGSSLISPLLQRQ